VRCATRRHETYLLVQSLAALLRQPSFGVEVRQQELGGHRSMRIRAACRSTAVRATKLELIQLLF
jgi:hypothetical protein